MYGHHGARRHGLVVFQPSQNKSVADFFLKLFELASPLTRDRRRLYVYGADMPAQPLRQDVIHVVSAFLPPGHGIAGLEGDRAPLPNILNPDSNYLLWIDLQHFRGEVHIVRTDT